MAEDIEKRIGQYIALRDAIKRVDERYEKEKAPLVALQERVSGLIQDFMKTNNITNNLKAKTGTCYLSTRWTASVADAEAFMTFVKAGNWDFIERRANSTAVKDYVKANNQLPPGCNLSGIQTLGVRRASGKTGE